jgi:hypothetical protein
VAQARHTPNGIGGSSFIGHPKVMLTHKIRIAGIEKLVA